MEYANAIPKFVEYSVGDQDRSMANRFIKPGKDLNLDFCRKEINIMKRLDHIHVINLLSTAIPPSEVGLILLAGET